jgi:hypothetical protein
MGGQGAGSKTSVGKCAQSADSGTFFRNLLQAYAPCFYPEGKTAGGAKAHFP